MDHSIREEIRTEVERALDRKFAEFLDLWHQGHHATGNFAQMFGRRARRESTLAGGLQFGRTGRELMQTKEEVYEYAQHLERFAHYLPIDVPDLGGLPVFASLSENVGEALIRWLEAPGSQFLWVDDLLTDPQNGVLTRMSMQICENASAARLPVVLFFRRDHYCFRQGSSMSAEHAGLIALLYSLILQFINLLPDSFRSRPTLTDETFRCLDGGLLSVLTALDILDNLLDHAPTALICVIDGLERLEMPYTMAAIEQLVFMLRRQSEGRRFKVLFTTIGTSEVLSSEMNVREQVLANRTTLGRAGGRLSGDMR
ncbi:hypothetical protein F5Y06DRAFT_297436 [Hypoxylon sp. FL0890]|nr:hypothetical protein F5Y06DRAFT_297436 [Hypoxylon sp. FL0890]